MNSNILLFVVFYLIMTGMYLGMQLIVYKLYQHWVRYSFSSRRARRSAWWAGAAILFVGNLLFLPRFFFILSDDLHNSSFVQEFIVEPGGIFFASLVFLTGVGILFFLYKGVRYLLHKISARSTAKLAAQAEAQQAAAATESRSTEARPKTEKPTTRSGGELLSPISRRRFIRTAGVLTIGAPFIMTSGLSASTHRNYVLTRQTLHFPQLPSGLEGLRLVHVSDLHSGIFMNKQQIQEIYEIINSLDPNLIAITGDFADNHVSEIPNVRDTIAMLKSDYGVFGCPGNHDHYASIDALVGALDDKPIDLLQNQTTNFKINAEKVSILGIDDPGLGARNYADFDGTYAKADPESFKILLSHRPHMFDTAHEHNVDLTLAGHTHGGQIGTSIAGIELYPIDLFHDYPRGHFRKGNHHLYVNVGVGLVAAPIRLVRPEITELTFTSDASKARRIITDA